jgi:hypothetical protein
MSAACDRTALALDRSFPSAILETIMTTQTWIAAAVAALSLGAAPVFAQDTASDSLELIGEIVLPTGLMIDGEEFGGISGLSLDPADGSYLAISDDRSERSPARFYRIRLIANADGVQGLDIVGSTVLRGLDGNSFTRRGIDPEAIVYLPGKRTFFWASESDVNGHPGIFESQLDGTMLRSLALPDYYLTAADDTRGTHGNLGFEGLTVSADGTTLFAITENALAQDGPKATLEAGSPSRILTFDAVTGVADAEYVYETGPIFAPATAEPNYNDNGVSDLMAMQDGSLLVVERSFGSGIGNEINLYRVEIGSATDVKGAETVMGSAYTPLTKTLLAKLGEGDFGLDIDNVEAVVMGPEIDGAKTLLIASDNNFNLDGQFTQFVLFRLNQ